MKNFMKLLAIVGTLTVAAFGESAFAASASEIDADANE